MENQPKLNSSKEVIAFLAERFPHCFSAEGEARREEARGHGLRGR